MNQLEWELACRQKKIGKKRDSIQSSIDRGYVSDTAVGQTILSQFIKYVATDLEEMSYKKTRGMGGKYASVMREAVKISTSHGNIVENYDNAAYIGMMVVLNNVLHKNAKKHNVSHIAEKIGEALEQEQMINIFNKDNEDYSYLKQHQIDKLSLRGKRKLFLRGVHEAWLKQGKEWEPWTSKIRIQIGMRVLKSTLSVMSGYLRVKHVKTGSRTTYTVVATQALFDFLAEHTDYLTDNLRSTQPCIEEPMPWKRDDDGTITGGFHSIECGATVPFCRTKTSRQAAFHASSEPSKHISAINKLQSVKWELNQDVLELLEDSIRLGLFPEKIPQLQKKEIPTRPETDDREWRRTARDTIKWNKTNVQRLLRFQSVISLTKFLDKQPFWFVYNTDFRGRIYCCSSYLNPQGPDYIKALLQFHEGKPLGKSGMKWLGVHGANCYGINKVSYSDRYAWVVDNTESIRQVARNFTSNTSLSFLRNASDPFQFYAFCKEWDSLQDVQNPREFVSHLSVNLDGSCNGFQHYAALLCDRAGAGRVNMVDGNLPQDLYAEVAHEFQARLTRDDVSPVGEQLRKLRIDRKFVKPVVMTIPYGITLQGASLAVYQQLLDDPLLDTEHIKDTWDKVRYITPIILDIASEFIKSDKLKQWLITCTEQFSKIGEPVHWISPVGFPVMQPYTLFKEEFIKTDLFGDKRIYYRDKPQGVMRGKSNIAVTPNFIHSLDASHLVMTIQKAIGEGVDTFTCVHDCIGTYAADTHKLRHSINEAFFELYRPNVLAGIQEQFEKDINTPEIPNYGDYNITEVITSRYFFS